MAKRISAEWRQLLSMLPGYDPFRDAGDCWFDVAEAERRINFFPGCLKHIEGPKAGTPFELERWQKAYIGNLFGWQMKDDAGRTVRRFRESLLYVPRGNGKTTISAGILLSCLLLDGEAGAQCYSAAAEKDQAALLFRHCSNMITRCPALEKRCRIYRGFKSIQLTEDQASFYRSLSADAPTKEGFNTHCVVIDELHAQPNRNLVDVLVESTKKKRAQPLVVYITTADYERESICNEIHEYAGRVRDGSVVNPRFLPAIYEASEKDDWTSPEVWRKANPNLGVSISEQDFRELIKKAQDIPALQNSTKRKHLNIKTRVADLAIDMEKWKACAHGVTTEQAMGWRKRKLLEMIGKRCVAGLDIGATNDLTALVLYFPEERPRVVLPFFWATEDAIERRRRRRVQYDLWVDEGWMTATEGNETHYAKLREEILAIHGVYYFQKLAGDRLFQGAQILQELKGEGIETVEFGQGFLSMAYPTRRLLEMIGWTELDHGNNPVLNWMAGNAASESDAAGSLKFSKSASTEKIDGVIALVEAVGVAEEDAVKAPSGIEIW